MFPVDVYEIKSKDLCDIIVIVKRKIKRRKNCPALSLGRKYNNRYAELTARLTGIFTELVTHGLTNEVSFANWRTQSSKTQKIYRKIRTELHAFSENTFTENPSNLPQAGKVLHVLKRPLFGVVEAFDERQNPRFKNTVEYWVFLMGKWYNVSDLAALLLSGRIYFGKDMRQVDDLLKDEPWEF